MNPEDIARLITEDPDVMAEADMSRRDFLKFLGKGAAIAATAQTPSVGLFQAVLNKILNRPDYAKYQKLYNDYLAEDPDRAFDFEEIGPESLAYATDAASYEEEAEEWGGPTIDIIKGYFVEQWKGGTEGLLEDWVFSEYSPLLNEKLGGFVSGIIDHVLREVGPSQLLKGAVKMKGPLNTASNLEYAMQLSPQFTKYMESLGVRSPEHWKSIKRTDQGVKVFEKAGVDPRDLETYNDFNTGRWAEKAQQRAEQQRAEQQRAELQKTQAFGSSHAHSPRAYYPMPYQEMNLKDIAQLITEDPSTFNEDWEEIGIEDPHKGLRKIVVRDYALHPMDFPGSENHVISRDLPSLAAFDREFSMSLLDLPKDVWALVLTQGFSDFTSDVGARVDLKNVNILDRDVKFHRTSGETFATNPLAHMDFTALVNEEQWLAALRALDRAYGDHGIDWRWDQP